MKKLALIALVGGFAWMANASNASAACGTFEVSKGDVKVESKGKAAAAAVGAKICSGEAVIAGPNSRAKIKMEDGNELNISPDSKIVLENYQFNAADNKKKVLLNVLKGKIRATTKEENMYNDKAKDGQANTFQVKTKAAVAGVRGTDFLTSYSPKTNTAEIVTFKGSVEVGRLGPGGTILNSVRVEAGMMTAASIGQLPGVPKVVPDSQLKDLDTDSGNKADTGASTRSGDGNRKPASPRPSMLGDKELAGDERPNAPSPSMDPPKPEAPRLPAAAVPTPPPQPPCYPNCNAPAKVNVKICIAGRPC